MNVTNSFLSASKSNSVTANKPPAVVTKPKPKPVAITTPEKKIIKNITEQVIQEDRKKITIRNVTVNENTYVYKKEEYIWGAAYFYKDGTFITLSTFIEETEH